MSFNICSKIYAWWHLNESSGSNVPDSSGNGRNGTTKDMEDGDWVSGKLNNCLRFDGLNEYVDCGAIADFERTDTFSVECWIKTSTFSKMIMSNSNGTRGWEMFITTAGKAFFSLNNNISGGNRLTRYSLAGVANGTWNHIIVTYDGSSTQAGLKMYINGSLNNGTGQDSLSDTTLSGTILCLGRRGSGGIYYNGDMDEVVIYDKELTADEVAYRWNSGAGIEICRSLVVLGTFCGLNAQEHKAIQGLGEGTLNVALGDRLLVFRRVVNVIVPLTARGYKSIIRVVNLILNLAVYRRLGLKKMFNIIVLLATQKYRSITGISSATLNLAVSHKKNIILTFKTVFLNLAASYKKIISIFKIVTLTMGASFMVGYAYRITKNAGLALSSGVTKSTRIIFDVNVSLFVARLKLSSKILKTGIDLLSAKNRFIQGLAGVVFTLNTDVEKLISVFFSVFLSATTGTTKNIKKLLLREVSIGPSVGQVAELIIGVTIGLSSGLTKFVGKALSAALVLAGAVTKSIFNLLKAGINLSAAEEDEGDFNKVINVTINTGASVTIKIFKSFAVGVTLSPDEEEEPEPHCQYITIVGAEGVAELIGGLNPAFLYLHLGSGTTPYTINDTQMEIGIGDTGLAPAVATTSNPANKVVRWTHTWTVTGTKTVSESGVSSNNAVGGANHLLFRTTFPAVTLENGDTITITHNLKVL